MKLNGKVAWVLGASSGIGAAVARELASRGGTVAISARREEQLRAVSQGHMLVVPADITDATSVAAAAARVHQQIGPIDLAVPLLMKAARLVPVRAWTALWARTSLT